MHCSAVLSTNPFIHQTYMCCPKKNVDQTIMDNPNWVQMEIEIEALCKLHNDAIANYEKCREFANRMSLFLSDLEDSGCNSLANMAMGILVNCNPKVASHCEKANMEQGLLEQMKVEIKKKKETCSCKR